MNNNQFKPARGLGQAINNARRKVIRETEALSEQRAKKQSAEARADLVRRSRRSQKKHSHESVFIEGILNAALDQSTAVMRSMSIGIPVRSKVSYDPNSRIQASTDWKEITIRWPWAVLQRSYESSEDLQETAFDMYTSAKGVMYHEIGHISYTVPFVKLLEAFNATLDPESTDHLRPTNPLMRAWNILEDQRMEAAVIRDSDIKRMYFERMMLKYVIDFGPNTIGYNWLLVAGRKYIDERLRLSIRAASMLDPDLVEDIVERYMSATDVKVMVKAVIELADLMANAPDPGGKANPHSGSYYDARTPEDFEDTIKDSASPEGNTNDEQSNSGGASGKEQDDSDAGGSDSGDGDSGDGDSGDGDSGDGDSGDGDNTQQSGKSSGDEDSDDQNNNSQSTSKIAGTHSGSASPQQYMESLAEELIERISQEIKHSDPAYKEAITVANMDANRTDKLKRLSSANGKMMDEITIDEALKVKVGIQRALADFVTISAPKWIDHVEDGTLVPINFRTRQIGEYDYYTSLDGAANEGLDLHLTFLADVSTSMTGNCIKDLSQVMYAVGLACKDLGIGTTFVLWSDGEDYYRVWDHSDPEPVIWPVFGGTDPTDALDALDSFNEENASHHLVILFTDGVIDTSCNLQRWSAPNQTIVMIDSSGSAYTTNCPDAHIPIWEISELPDKLSVTIRDTLSSSL